MPESIKQLRELCQRSRDDTFYQIPWHGRIFFRSISIYFTKLFLKVGFSANQVTFIDLFIGVIAGVFFTFGNTKFWLIGILLVYLHGIFDCVDGEIARYRGTTSTIGTYLDNLVGYFTWPYILACMTFGIYSVISSSIIFIFGFIAVISRLLYSVAPLLVYPSLHSIGLLSEAIKIKGIGKTSLMRYGSILFGILGFTFTILVVTLIDWFLFSPITISHISFIGQVTVNARGIYLIIYGLVALAAFILKAIYVIRNGVKL